MTTPYAVGDFLLVERPGPASWLIRTGQSWRFTGEDRKYAKFTHAALIVSDQGDLVEALFRRGVVRSSPSKYDHLPHVHVRVGASVEDQAQILRFAEKILGERYARATDICCGIAALTGSTFTFGFQGQSMCAGLVARAEERTGAYFDRLAEDICPADLGRYYKVLPSSLGGARVMVMA